MPLVRDERGRPRPHTDGTAAHSQRQVSHERVSRPAPRTTNPVFPPRNVTFQDSDTGLEREQYRERYVEHTPSSYYGTGYDPFHFQRPIATQNKALYEPVRYSPLAPRPPPAPRTAPPKQVTLDDESDFSDWYDPDSTRRRSQADVHTRDRVHRHPPPDTYYYRSPARPAVHVNPEDPKDVTVHMSLDTTPGVEGFLEENARLRRLGHFTEAIAQFEKKLLPYLDNKYVLVQYGHCLYDARQYRKLAELAKKYPSVAVEVEDYDDIQLNWNLLLRKAETVSELDFHNTIDAKQLTAVALSQMNGAAFDSTQIQNLTLAICIATELKVKEGYAWHYDYLSMKDQQRIWDFRDLFLALEEKLGLKEARDLVTRYNEMLGREESPIETIIADWSELDEGESTYFGALDLFSSLAFACMKDKGNIKDAEKCLVVAERFATYLLELDVRNLKTRPCLLWMMARVFFEEYKLDNHEDNNIFFKGTLRGEYRVSTRIFPNDELPLYSPFEDEIPEWKPRATGIPEESKQTTRIVLKAAEEIGDVPVQVGCLQQLLDQGSDNPAKEVKQISKLLMASGNMAPYLRFQLFRFMLVKTEQDKAALRRDILGHGECLSVGFSEYCRCMVLRALTSKAWEKELYLTRAEDANAENSDGDDDDGEGESFRKPPKKDEVVIIERPKKDSAKDREKKDARTKKKEEDEKRRNVEAVERVRRDLEKDMEIKKLKEELEALKRTRPPPAQLEWVDPQSTTASKKKKKKRIDEADGAKNDVDKDWAGVVGDERKRSSPRGWDKTGREAEASTSATAVEVPIVEDVP